MARQVPGLREIYETVLKLVGKMIYQFNSRKLRNHMAQQLGKLNLQSSGKTGLRTAKPFWFQQLTNQIASLNNSIKKFLTWIHRSFKTEVVVLFLFSGSH